MTIAQIKADLQRRGNNAINKGMEVAFRGYKDEITLFYNSYSPDIYQRTGAFASSIQMGGIVSSGFHFSGRINATAPSYSTGNWGAGQIYDSNMSGSHGGVFTSSPVWENVNSFILRNVKPAIISAFM